MNKTIYQLMSVFMALAIALGSFTTVRAATPKTYYVSNTGNDLNSGSATAPFKTFTKATSVLLAGDTLKINAGTYTQQLTVSKSGTAAAPITIQAVAGQKVILDGSMTRDRAIIVTGSYINLDGIETQRALQFCVDLTGSNINVKNFLVHDCQQFGARIKGKNVTFEGSTLYNNVLENTGGTNTTGGWAGTLRVGLGGENVTLRNNTIYNNWGEGIGVGQGRFINIYNNVVHDNYSQNIYINNSTDVNVENNFTYSVNSKYYRSGAPANCIGMADEYYSGWGAQLARVRVVNNIAAFCKRGIGYTYSENPDGGMDTVTIAYNTIWDTTEFGIVAIDQPTKTRNSVISNNIVYQAEGKLIDIQVSSGITYSNNFWASPAVNIKDGNGDRTGNVNFAGTPGLTSASFALSGSSPAIGGAVSLGITKDYAGNLRGPAYDMGALQYKGTVTQTSTPVPATVTPTADPVTATPTVVVTPTVAPTTDPAVETVFDDKNAAFVYSAGWKNVLGKPAYGGSYKQTSQNNAWATFDFTGQSFSVIYKGGPTYRTMEVYVDGVLVDTIDENKTVSTYKARWDYPGQLEAGSHTLMLVFVTTRTTSKNCSLDAVIVR